MRVAIAITPAAVVVIGDIGGDIPLPHTLEVRDQARLKQLQQCDRQTVENS